MRKGSEMERQRQWGVGHRASAGAGGSALEHDIAAMATYWGERTHIWLDEAAQTFDELVRPFTYHIIDVTAAEIQVVNLCFTEWVLFERAMRAGKTPIELYIERRPAGVSADALARLQQVADTQFFSRFTIIEKNRETGMAVLRDTETGIRYDVLDTRLCAVDRWRGGVIALRIARVDGLWQTVGATHLYDAAPPEATAVDGPGAVHLEDLKRAPHVAAMSFYLRFLRDAIGMDGRYIPTFHASIVSGA